MITVNAVAGSAFGTVKAFFLNSVIRALSFLAVASATCTAVFFTRTFGLAFDFAFVFGLAFAVVPAFGFALGFALGFAFGLAFVVKGLSLVAGLVVVVAFFRGVFVVLPVCAFGLDAGFVAKNRRPKLMTLPFGLHVCSFGKVYPVGEVVMTRRVLYDSVATRSVADGGPLHANRRTMARPVLTIMTIDDISLRQILVPDQFVKMDARGLGGQRSLLSRDAETIRMAGSLLMYLSTS